MATNLTINGKPVTGWRKWVIITPILISIPALLFVGFIGVAIALVISLVVGGIALLVGKRDD